MQQVIPEREKYRNEREQQQHAISIQLICQTSLDSENTRSLNEDQKIQIVLALRLQVIDLRNFGTGLGIKKSDITNINLKSIHLQWLNIRNIQNLEVFSNLNILYQQHNKIKKIEHLDTLINLQYLALNDNFITKSQNLSGLKKLMGLNLNNNQIDEIDYKGLPSKLQLLSYKNNPVCLDSDYKISIFQNCKDLDMLDDYNVTPEDKFKALGIFPQHLVDYATKMKHFRNKKQIKAQILQAQNKQKSLLLGSTVNQKQTISEIRDKTNKYLIQSQQTFKQQSKDQQQNFQERIKVSKKIRQIKQNEEKNKRNRMQKIKQEQAQYGQESQQTRDQYMDIKLDIYFKSFSKQLQLIQLCVTHQNWYSFVSKHQFVASSLCKIFHYSILHSGFETSFNLKLCSNLEIIEDFYLDFLICHTLISLDTVQSENIELFECFSSFQYFRN